MTDEEPTDTSNTISGGIFYGPVLQGRDIQARFHLPAAAPVALAQLPAATAGFTGRDDELAVLAELLDPDGTAESVVVSAVAGLPGVGKTTLAVEAGHAALQRGWFGGGVLFIGLHGYDETPVEPGQALDALLRALGVSAEHIPPSAEQRAGLYRSTLANLDSLLLIVDNASSEAQVRPLLPGTGPHKVLVTSRHTLAGLNARLVDVAVLDDQAAVHLLDAALRAGRPEDDRITRDDDAGRRLAGVCGGLPLALQIVAALLKADLARHTSELADDLAVEHERLERLAYDDGSGSLSVAAAFELSYRHLDELSAKVFRLLPLNPGPDFSTAAVVVLAELRTSRAREVLADLARAHLLESAPGTSRRRMHDLLRLYAQRLSDQYAEADRREQARDRLFSHYLRLTSAASDHLRPRPGSATAEVFPSRDAALEWLDAERASVVAAVIMAAETGRDQVAMDLPLVLGEYLSWRRQFEDRLIIATTSRDTARRLGDRRSEATALNQMGIALGQMQRFGEAIFALQGAVAIWREIGDRHDEGIALDNLGIALREERRFEEAIRASLNAVGLFKATGDRRGISIALNNLSILMQMGQRLDQAISTLQEVAAFFREANDHRGQGIALTNLGLALSSAERFEEAFRISQRAVDIFQQTRDRHEEGTALNSLGLALNGLRRYVEAITAFQEAAVIFRETDDRDSEDVALRNVDKARAAQAGMGPAEA